MKGAAPVRLALQPDTPAEHLHQFCAHRLGHKADRGARCLGILGRLQKQRLVQEQRDRLAVGARELRLQPFGLFQLAQNPCVHDQRVQPDEAPTRGLELPAIFAEHGEKNLPVAFGGRLRRSRADLRRIVADVMIAGQVTTADRK